MTTIALLTTRAPDPLADELMRAGYTVTEALWGDEVLQLLETERIDALVITHDVVDDPAVPELQRSLTTLRLEPLATAKDIVWQLSQLFPWRTGAIQ